jgi:hypothetical protein
MATIAELKALIRRPRGKGVNETDDKQRNEYSRTQQQEPLYTTGNDGPITDAVVRSNTALATPDDTRGLSFVGSVFGDRLQDYANSHLSEGEAPGRIPHFWNDRRSGKVGRGITGNSVGDNSLTLDATGTGPGGIGDARYIQHQQIPRGSVIARAFARTVDDSANIPGVYVSDPGRR